MVSHEMINKAITSIKDILGISPLERAIDALPSIVDIRDLVETMATQRKEIETVKTSLESIKMGMRSFITESRFESTIEEVKSDLSYEIERAIEDTVAFDELSGKVEALEEHSGENLTERIDTIEEFLESLPQFSA